MILMIWSTSPKSGSNAPWGHEIRTREQLQPVLRFPGLFQHELELVNEVGATLGAAGFPVVGSRRRGGAHQLIGDIATCRRSFQAATEPDNIHREAEESLSDIRDFDFCRLISDF
jgi:hypothetical protein